MDIVPVADGGEGTAEIIYQAVRGEWVMCAAHDALGRCIEARYAWMEKTRTAVLDMSEAAGLRRLGPGERDIMRATTFGVGEMIRHAAKLGAAEIIVGLGGSATNDAGCGLARALGFRFFRGNEELANGPADLSELTRIVPPAELTFPKIIAATDVQNPLLGERGATRVFAAQKGATSEQIDVLETALANFAETIARDFQRDFRGVPGAGSAGGLGFGLLSFCSAQLRSGFDVVAEVLGLEEKVRHADIVITGEGRLDAQTGEGKAPAGVAKLARKWGKPVYAIVGERDASADLFDGVFELARLPVSRGRAMECASELLRKRAAELTRELVNRRATCRKTEC